MSPLSYLPDLDSNSHHLQLFELRKRHFAEREESSAQESWEKKSAKEDPVPKTVGGEFGRTSADRPNPKAKGRQILSSLA